MTSPEMREAALKLIRQGHKRIFLVSGQLPNADVDYLAEAISILYTLFDGVGEIHSVNVNVGPLESSQYQVLQRTPMWAPSSSIRTPTMRPATVRPMCRAQQATT